MNLIEKGIVALLTTFGVGATISLGNRLLVQDEKSVEIAVTPDLIRQLEIEKEKEKQKDRMQKLLEAKKTLEEMDIVEKKDRSQEGQKAVFEPEFEREWNLDQDSKMDSNMDSNESEELTAESISEPIALDSEIGGKSNSSTPVAVIGDTPEAALNRIESRTVQEDAIDINTKSFSPKIAPVVSQDVKPSNLEYERIWKKLADRGIPVSQFTEDTGIKINPDFSVNLDGKNLSVNAFECYVNGYIPNMKHIKPNCGW